MQKLQITWESTVFFLIYFGRMKKSSDNGTSHKWDEGMFLVLPTLGSKHFVGDTRAFFS